MTTASEAIEALRDTNPTVDAVARMARQAGWTREHMLEVMVIELAEFNAALLRKALADAERAGPRIVYPDKLA